VAGPDVAAFAGLFEAPALVAGPEETGLLLLLLFEAPALVAGLGELGFWPLGGALGPWGRTGLAVVDADCFGTCIDKGTSGLAVGFTFAGLDPRPDVTGDPNPPGEPVNDARRFAS
jgi:hypothetical protein